MMSGSSPSHGPSPEAKPTPFCQCAACTAKREAAYYLARSREAADHRDRLVEGSRALREQLEGALSSLEGARESDRRRRRRIADLEAELARAHELAGLRSKERDEALSLAFERGRTAARLIAERDELRRAIAESAAPLKPSPR